MPFRLARQPARFPPTILAAMLLAAGLGSGCGSIRMSDTSRTATEQLLLTQAWDTAIGAVDFGPLVGPPVFLDTENLSGVDTGWMTYRIRESMARQGVILVDDREEAVCVVEAGAAVYGTDSSSCLIGMPSNGIVASAAGARGLELPEVALAKKTEQYGVSRLAMFARDLPSGKIVWESGTVQADSYLKNASILGLPMRSGTIEHPADRRKKHKIARMLGWLRPHRHEGHEP
ncbi:DUF6655 family protein [Tautonia plasticadhaerens]|uniref:Uncharacterized protein n=1 Tax=Tautonia plasticadhaerens TaxID=2527974 RepID=A0A518HD55_9BACT|nr:DUF6655 family protein [Tautonia plasticadhaerens]QDV38792.1 hypothetical protein ElP_67490 [Tautonia plasticadhaerens]